ncbi:cysteine-rich receptor-like protein kinase 10 isoform X2 [Herrania umbratica]|uniref:non-specific serine/threonine protein kinase n=1 Tax=Herrania umbratica TaxID=108875 RepID=A0A6J1B4F5_9ROSI|nr:cysteine-rich receptor-like protein kinase 10 isoform X2 [Herrania umbratica]
MTLLYKSKAFLLFLITISALTSFITCQSPTYSYHYCLGPDNDTATAGYKSNLTDVLDSISSKASNDSFYNDSLNGIYSLFLCRGDVSSDVCQDCVSNATQTLTQRCPSDKSAVIWYDQCMLRYSNINFFGLVRLLPGVLMWNTLNDTSPDEGTIGAQGLIFSLVDHAPYTENMFETKEMVVGNGPDRRYGLVQCSRDLNVSACSSCLRDLLDQTENCCIEKRGWRILTPSCYIRYEMYQFYEQPSAPPPENEGDGKGGNSTRKTIIIIVSSLAGVFVSVLVGFFFLYYSSLVRKRRQEGEGTSQVILLRSCQGSKRADLMEAGIHLSDEDHSGELHHINLATIQSATNNFSRGNKLGEGGFGPVYKGKMPNGKEIAVKRLSLKSSQGLEEFKNEVKLIFKLQHKNLVRLLGYCLEEEEKLLIYEYMANTSLDAFLFDPEKCKVLDWEKRSNIINGTARGLQYLHEDSRLKIIHRDLKASNVLLDDDMNPKISDFGTARIFAGNQIEANTERVVGTYGYMAPEYALEGLFSNKSDVYSFGILTLEILSGKKNRGFYHQDCGQSLITYAWQLWNDGRGLELIDSNIADGCPIDDVVRWIHIALLCVQDDPALRPTMSSVILMLGSRSVNLPQPSSPPYSAARFVTTSDLSSTTQTETGILTSDQSSTTAAS